MTDAASIAGDPDALYVSGLLHLRAGAASRAIDSLAASLDLQPDHAGARRNLIRALLATGQSGAALTQADYALIAEPRSSELHYARGSALNALNRPAEAVAALRLAVSLAPGHAASWLNLGNACADLDDLATAENCCRTAIVLDPALAEAHASLGYLLTAQGDLAGAIGACEVALRLRPDFVQAHWNLATAALLAGDLPRGFREYEWRKRHDRFRRDFINLPGQLWDGSDPAGRTILVKSEQGFGDTIQFSRYLASIACRGGHPVLACEPPLMPLFAAQPGISAVGKDDPLPRYDAWIDQMSLPLVFGTTLDTIPAASGYLRADPARMAAWGDSLPAGLVIGLAWAGNPLHSNDRRRSMPAAALAPLLGSPPGSSRGSSKGSPAGSSAVSFVSLQLGQAMKGLRDLTPALTDFAETAALIACLDLVITIDTAVAHLAGALGVPAWIMLPHAPDWRWIAGRDDSPWYDSVRLFRQPKPGDWSGVVDRVADALTEWMSRSPDGDTRRPVRGQKRSSP